MDRHISVVSKVNLNSAHCTPMGEEVEGARLLHDLCCLMGIVLQPAKRLADVLSFVCAEARCLHHLLAKRLCVILNSAVSGLGLSGKVRGVDCMGFKLNGCD